MSKNLFGDDFQLTLITNNVDVASMANKTSINRIGLDLEYINKAARQSQFSTRLSYHSISDFRSISKVVDKSKLFARINPISDNSRNEINQLIELGVNYLMLPYFKTAQELEHFIELVDGRAFTIGLLETPAAIIRINNILKVSGIDEIMIGLNDLRIGMGVHNHFEVLSSPIMDAVCKRVLESNISLTLGGIAPPQASNLPVDPQLVHAQYPRLGATGAWVARSLFNEEFSLLELHISINQIRNSLTECSLLSAGELEQKRQELEKNAIRISHQNLNI